MHAPFPRLRPRLRCLLTLGLPLLAFLARGWETDAVWRPASAPLMSRWASEVSPAHAHPEYPRPQCVRVDWLNLNGLWEYQISTNGAAPPAGYAGQILVPYPIESALSGVARRLDGDAVLWYRRVLAVPKSWRDRRVRLHFGGVDWWTRVFVNGRAVGQHRGGYDAFSFDITPCLRWEGAEEIRVAVTDPTEGDQPRGKQSRKPEGIFYTPTSGIWQTVWLEPVPAVALDELKLTPDLDHQALRVRAAVASLDNDLSVEAVALDQGREVGRVAGPPNDEMLLPLVSPRLWSPDDPFLYDLRVTLKRGSNRLDQVTSYFGMRKIALRKDERGLTRIALNDRVLFQVGTLDQGFWPDGIYSAPTDGALRADLEFLKRAGFNMTRKHVKVEPERWYYWCDKLGLLVWQDMPSGNNATPEGRRNFEAELLHMMKGLHNHPSIVLWVLFNEGWGQYDTERLVGWMKSADPSRLVNNASGWTDQRVGDVIDMHSYPVPLNPSPESRRAAVSGEFGGLGLRFEGHSWSARSWDYQSVRDTATLDAEYGRLLGMVWENYEQRGLSAAVYTQTTDVETECNGLLTYDREVIKPTIARLLQANKGLVRPPPQRVLLPDGSNGEPRWRYTTELPPKDWFQPHFDASAWSEGVAGFGRPGTPGALIRTAWSTPEIWLRRHFVLPAQGYQGAKLRIHHDEDAEVYLNGVLAADLPGFVTTYVETDFMAAAMATLKPGTNTIAVHCRQTIGAQCIDLGIVAPLLTPGDSEFGD